MFHPVNSLVTSTKQRTDHLQLHSMLRGCRRASCVLAEPARAAPVSGLVWMRQDALHITFDSSMSLCLDFTVRNPSAPLLIVCSAS